MTAAALGRGRSRADLPRALKGNLCRCTGYRAIGDAVARRAAIDERPAPGERPSGAACPRPAGARRRHRARAASRSTSTVRRAAAPQAAALAARARPDRLDRHRRRRCAVPGRVGRAHPRGRRPTCSSPPPGTRTAHDDPDDTRVLDDVVRFVGPAGRRRGRRDGRPRPRRAAGALAVDYEVLPAVFDPEQAMAPGAPAAARRQGPAARGIADPRRNVAGRGARRARRRATPGFAEADVVVRGRPSSTQRVQHAHLETHGAIGWLDDGGRLVRPDQHARRRS